MISSISITTLTNQTIITLGAPFQALCCEPATVQGVNNIMFFHSTDILTRLSWSVKYAMSLCLTVPSSPKQDWTRH